MSKILSKLNRKAIRQVIHSFILRSTPLDQIADSRCSKKQEMPTLQLCQLISKQDM